MRKDERAEDQRIRQRERDEDVNYRNETLGLQKDQAARQKSEYDYKVLERTKAKKQENLKKSVAVAKGLFKAGYERESVGVVTKAYNSLNDKGDEGILIHKGDGGGIDAEANGPGESPWDKPEAKGANMLFLSKNFGMIPFKSAKDAINMMDSFVYGEKEDETVVIGKDQTLMNKRTGEVIGKGVGPSKLEEYKEKINLMTTTYKHLGSSLMGKAAEEDFLGPAGQPTDEANTAYKKAISILMKAEKDPKSLTPMEAKMLPIAGNMVKFYQDSLTYIGENRESLFGAKQPSGKQGLTNTPPKGGEKSAQPKSKEKPSPKNKKPGLTPPEKPKETSKKKNPFSGKPKITSSDLDVFIRQVKPTSAGLESPTAKKFEDVKKAARWIGKKIKESEQPLQAKIKKMKPELNRGEIEEIASLIRSAFPEKTDIERANMIGK